MIRDKTLDRTLDRLRKPEPRLVPTYTFDYRTRRRGDYLLVLQRPPLRAKATWRDHSIPSRWAEKIDRRIHPHAKPAGLITRLIVAVTELGDLAIDPAAGGFTVMCVAHELGRRFVGCDIAYGDAP